MSDIVVPSTKDVGDFAALIAEHGTIAVAALIVLAFVAILVGVLSKLQTWAVAVVSFTVLLFLAGAGGYAIYKIVPTEERDTAIVFKLKLPNAAFRVESFALNTYVGGVDGDATQRRLLFRVKDEPGDWVSIRLARVCPPSESDVCPAIDFTLPAWLIRSSEVRHFRDEGAGVRIVVSHRVDGKEQSCTVFPDPKPNSKPSNYSGPDLCASSPPLKPPAKRNSAALENRGSWWIGRAWAADLPVDIDVVREQLADLDPQVRAKGRVALQKAPNAADLLARIVDEPGADARRNRLVANALIAAIYFGDERWKDVTPATKTKIVALLSDEDDLVSRYARSVLRRYPQEAVQAEVKAAAAVASGESRKKLLIAAADIEYNLGVVRLLDARAAKTDMSKWQATFDLFNAGIAIGQTLPGSSGKEPDVAKSYFGLALSTADKWSSAKPADMTEPQVRATFAKFLDSIDVARYPFSEQVEAATCVTKTTGSERSKFEKDLGDCLKFFR